MVKVLFVTEPLVKNSGVTSVVLNIIRNINDKTIHIDLLTFPGGDQNVEEELASIGCKLSYLKCNKLSNLFAIFKECDSFFRSNYYDIVHSHFNQIDYVLFMAAKKNGINNLISHSHNSKLSDSNLRQYVIEYYFWVSLASLQFGRLVRLLLVNVYSEVLLIAVKKNISSIMVLTVKNIDMIQKIGC